MTLNEKNQISQAVGEYFLRVVKNHNYYLRFKDTFFKVQNIKKSINFKVTNGNVYLSAIHYFADKAEHEYLAHRQSESIYEYITIFINMILRNYLEAGGVDPRKLGMIGQELFDLSCYGVFGDQYIDDMNKIQEQTGVRAARNEKEAWAMAEYEARRRHGENIDFEEFMKSRCSIPDEEFWNRSANLENLDVNIDEDIDEDEDDGWYDDFDEYVEDRN